MYIKLDLGCRLFYNEKVEYLMIFRLEKIYV